MGRRERPGSPLTTARMTGGGPAGMTLSLHSVSELVNIYNPRPLSPTFLIGGSNQSRDPAFLSLPFLLLSSSTLVPDVLNRGSSQGKDPASLTLPFLLLSSSTLVPDLIGDPGTLRGSSVFASAFSPFCHPGLDPRSSVFAFGIRSRRLFPCGSFPTHVPDLIGNPVFAVLEKPSPVGRISVA